MKRQNIEVVLGFLDAIRRSDGEAAAQFLHPEIVWQGVLPDLVRRSRVRCLASSWNGERTRSRSTVLS